MSTTVHVGRQDGLHFDNTSLESRTALLPDDAVPWARINSDVDEGQRGKKEGYTLRTPWQTRFLLPQQVCHDNKR